MTVLDIPARRIASTPARELDLSRALLTIVAAALYAAGWVARRIVRVHAVRGLRWRVGYVRQWCRAAVQLGWQDGAPGGSAR